MKPSDDISIERLNELFSYNPDTGSLVWKLPRGPRRAGTEVGAATPNRRTAYRYAGVDGKGRMVHRLIWAMVHGRFPDGEIDHIDGDGLNNRISNLRDVTATQNSRNCRLRKDSRSGIKDVTWHKASRKWRARIRVDTVERHLGIFDNQQDAIVARLNAERKYFGDFARQA